MRAVLKYPGSKWSLSDRIISLFPEHHSYLEPFFGSGAILFNKPRSDIETVNDLDGNVVNLFECIRTDPERLARSIYMTPYSREVYENACQAVPGDKFEAALYFYIATRRIFWEPGMGSSIGAKWMIKTMRHFWISY